MASASIMPVGPSLDSVRLRSTLLLVAGAAQAAMPSHALAALTALNREETTFVVSLQKKAGVQSQTGAF